MTAFHKRNKSAKSNAANAAKKQETPTGRPARDEPGTLRQNLAAISHFLGMSVNLRRADREDCWQVSRGATIPHARRRT
jgi:hypothetical protein